MNATTEPPNAPRVLLVDDEPRICAALAGPLVTEGFEVVMAESGDEAIRMFPDGRFDIVLLDLRMPGRSGWEILAQFTWTRPLLPVIVITALPGQTPAALAAGVGALLEKPLDIPILLETMRQLLVEPMETRLARIARRVPQLDPHHPGKMPSVPFPEGVKSRRECP